MFTIQVGLSDRAYFELERRAQVRNRSMQSQAEEEMMRGMGVEQPEDLACPSDGTILVWDDPNHGHCAVCPITIHRLAPQSGVV